MKESIVLTRIEAAAFNGLASRLADAQAKLAVAQREVSGIFDEIAAVHKVVIAPGTAVTSAEKDGRLWLEWEVKTEADAQDAQNKVIKFPGNGATAPVEACCTKE